MKFLKIAGIAIAGYVGLVVVFETLIGVIQPTAGSTLVITTYDEAGEAHERVLSRLESEGQLYVAANHWPRAWYERALTQPDVRITSESENGPYRAVPVHGAERDRADLDNPLGLIFRFVTGFPPRHFLRLDAR